MSPYGVQYNFQFILTYYGKNCNNLLFLKFPTILSTKLVCAFKAFKYHIAIFPKSFRVYKNAYLPHKPYIKNENITSDQKKAIYRNNLQKYHQMVPAEYSSDCAVFIFHYKHKRTPYTTQMLFFQSPLYAFLHII